MENAQQVRKFLLKPMVLARILAEASVLTVLLVLPVVLLLLGKFQALPLTYKFIFVVLCLVACALLPVYGFITYQVRVTETTISADALFRKQSLELSRITGLARRSNFNFVRYVVDFDGGELTFPIWLKGLDELVGIIREHLPVAAAGRRSALGRSFSQDPISVIFQFLQVVLSLVFIGVVWCFTYAMRSGSGLSRQPQSGFVQGSAPVDLALLVIFALCVTAIMLYRAYMVLLMPLKIRLSESELRFDTIFGVKTVDIAALKSVAPPLPLLPEGYVIKTSKGSFLVGNGLDAADELEEALKERIGAK